MTGTGTCREVRLEDLGPGWLPGRAARLPRHRMCPRMAAAAAANPLAGAGVVTACGRYKAVPRRTGGAIMPRRAAQ
jgi:hypothetical protein